MKTLLPSITIILFLTLSAFGQTKEAYDQPEGQTNTAKGLLDPSRFDIHQAMSFGASTGAGSSLKSQSLYTTMIQYKFAQPVTLNLNFGLPIFSTYNQAQNLTTQNIQSMEYFKNMPFDATLSWMPKQNLLLQLSIIRRTADDYLSNQFFSPLDRQFDYLGNRW
jgi:hypothetical protein